MNKNDKQKSKKLSKQLKLGVKAVVIAGAESGREGEVIQIVGDKVKFKGINMRQKVNGNRRRPHLAKGFIESESLIHMSNVRLIQGDTQ